LIVVEDCEVTRGQIDRDLTGTPFEICAYEWKSGETLWPEEIKKVGAFDSRGFLSVHLPPDAFQQLWVMGDGHNTSTFVLIIKVRIEPSESVLSVTEVTVMEYLP
jgi:hypothetical protein